MIEKAARAAHETRGVYTMADSERVARAVLGAIREPAFDVLSAGLLAGTAQAEPGILRMREQDEKTGSKGWIAAQVAIGSGSMFKAAWQAQIDAILAEKP